MKNQWVAEAQIKPFKLIHYSILSELHFYSLVISILVASFIYFDISLKYC